MTANTKSTAFRNRIRVFPVILFVVAGLALVSSVLTLIYSFSFEHGLTASMMFFQASLGPIAGQVIALLISGIQNIIQVFSGLLFLFSILLYAAGKNSLKSLNLTDRVAELEARFGGFEPVIVEAAKETAG